MILTCPECLAKYVVDPKALMPAGRTVRCAKCRHTWHEETPPAETPMLEETEGDNDEPVNIAEEGSPQEQSAAAAETPQEAPQDTSPDISAKPTEETANEGAASDFELSIKQRKKRPRPIPKGSNLPALQNHNHGSSRWGWISLCVFVTAIVSSLLIFRETVSEFWPPSARLYHAIGLDGEKSATHTPAPPKKKEEPKVPVSERLAIQNLVPAKEIRNGTPYLVVRGEVRNITEEKQTVPVLQVALQDSRGVTIRNWTFMTSPGVLSPEAVVDFETSLPDPPPDARDLRVSFTEQ
ncbi:zinc-ribbon domain-containing protein [Emcibacter sp.]|uniref:zinc-ribbon domain-containing protein n=1 Tax=Emcibacter sp. TaxID=1979954 RepID=UPI003A906D98